MERTQQVLYKNNFDVSKENCLIGNSQKLNIKQLRL